MLVLIVMPDITSSNFTNDLLRGISEWLYSFFTTKSHFLLCYNGTAISQNLGNVAWLMPNPWSIFGLHGPSLRTTNIDDILLVCQEFVPFLEILFKKLQSLFLARNLASHWRAFCGICFQKWTLSREMSTCWICSNKRNLNIQDQVRLLLNIINSCGWAWR